MAFLRAGFLSLVVAATTLSTAGTARAEEPSRNGLPHGISLGSNGRYYKDVCDHSRPFYCLSKRLLPETYRPLDGPPAGPFAGGGGECTCGQMNPCGGGGASAPAGAMTPKDVLAAYKVPASSSAGGKIVAILDLPDANALKDLNVYRKAYGIPALPACPGNGLPDPGGGTPCFAAVDETGAVTSSAGDCQGADAETGLDTEMVSAACPDCSILLVQLTTAMDTDFVTGTKAAIKLGAVAISISFGGPESPGFDPTGAQYTTPGHLVFAASGDAGYLNESAMFAGTPSYPASAPDVLGVGGTTLQLSGTKYSEVVWNDTSMGGAGGSGCSTEFAMPAFQKTFLSANANAFGSCAKRASVDVSAAAEFYPSADPNSGAIAEYDSVNAWGQVVGTSAASPMVAGLFTRLGLIDAVSGNLGWVYENMSAFNDVTSGTNDFNGNCASVLCKAGKGWDGPTGVGTPNGENLAALVPVVGGDDAGVDGGGDGGTSSKSQPAGKSGCGCNTAAAGGLGPLWLALGAVLGAFALRRYRR